MTTKLTAGLTGRNPEMPKVLKGTKDSREERETEAEGKEDQHIQIMICVLDVDNNLTNF